MRRRARTPAVVIPRLAEELDRIEVEKIDGGWRISIAGDPIEKTYRTRDALAFLADLAWRDGVDPKPIGFTGKPPARGLAAWQADAINWLAGRDR